MIQSLGLPESPLPVPSSTVDVGALGRKKTDELSDEELERAAKGLEGVFVSMLVGKLREGMTEEGLFGSDDGGIYGGLFDQMMGEQLSERGGIGIAEMVVRAEMQRRGGKASEDVPAAEGKEEQ